jgi:hypothetical protein
MNEVLVAPSTVVCPHAPGTVRADKTSRLTVGKKPVLLAGIDGKTIDGCPITTSQSTSPCRTVSTVVTSGKSKLTVGRVSVLLVSVTGISNGVPPGAITATASQTRLTAAAVAG